MSSGMPSHPKPPLWLGSSQRSNSLQFTFQGTEYMDEEEVASWMADNSENAASTTESREPSAPQLPLALEVDLSLQIQSALMRDFV